MLLVSFVSCLVVFNLGHSNFNFVKSNFQIFVCLFDGKKHQPER